MRRLPVVHMLRFAATLLVVLVPSGSQAVTIDGRLDPEYGAPIATQSVQTHDNDALVNTHNLQSSGSELDEAFGFIARDTLFVLMAGNLGDYVGNQPSKDMHQFLLLDTGAPGQNVIVPGAALDLFRIGGLTLDAGFQASYALVSSWAGSGLNEEFCALPPGGPGTGYTVGTLIWSSPQGSSVSGGPDGIQAGVDNSSLAGVTYGCDASSGAGVTSGIEWMVPLAAIGHPAGCVRVCALIFDGNYVTNQVLASVPVGTCSLGPPSSASFAATSGDQFFSICSAQTSIHSSTWGTLKIRYR